MSNSSSFNCRIKNYIKEIFIYKSKISVAYKGLVQEYLKLIDENILNENSVFIIEMVLSLNFTRIDRNKLLMKLYRRI
jgi:hypothetical protein